MSQQKRDGVSVAMIGLLLIGAAIVGLPLAIAVGSRVATNLFVIAGTLGFGLVFLGWHTYNH